MAVPAPKAPQKIEAPEELMELRDWWEKHGNLCSTILLVVVAIYVGITFWRRHQATVADEAAAAAATARSVEDFEKVATEFPSTGEAPVSLLKAAAEYCRTGQYAVAGEKYTAFLKKYSSHELAPIAKLGIAYVAEAQGTFDAAEKGYSDFLATEDGKGYLAPVATLGRARCLALQGKSEEARTILDQMTADNSNTIWALQADDLKANLTQMKFVKPDAKSFDDILSNALDVSQATPAEEKPAEEAAKPAEEAKPVEEEKPAEEAKPVEEAAPAPAPEA